MQQQKELELQQQQNQFDQNDDDENETGDTDVKGKKPFYKINRKKTSGKYSVLRISFFNCTLLKWR